MGGSLRRRSDIVFFRVLLFVVVVLFFWSVCVFCLFFFGFQLWTRCAQAVEVGA